MTLPVCMPHTSLHHHSSIAVIDILADVQMNLHPQVFPKIYETVLSASSVLQQLCKQGPVDVSKVSARLTAGMIKHTLHVYGTNSC